MPQQGRNPTTRPRRLLADLNRSVRPAFAVMDGTIGLEGNGPKSGRPRVADLILASQDPVALDTVQALCMGLDPARIGHLASCGARGVGVSDPERIEIRGCDLASARVAFQPARQNAVAAVETLFRRSAFRRLVFETDLRRLSVRREAVLPDLDRVAGPATLGGGACPSGVRPAVARGGPGRDAALVSRRLRPDRTMTARTMTARSAPIVILGGGLSGMAAAHALARAGCSDVTIVERGPKLGGLAGSFEHEGHSYPLGYHHILHRDRTLLYVLDAIGALPEIRWRRVRMLFRLGDRLHDLGSPIGFLRFPMSLADKARFARLMLRAP